VHDIVIRNAKVVDGTGAPAFAGDVAIDGERITAVVPRGEHDSTPATGRREIDADGRLLTPGWIDIHTHYDGQATWDPEMTPSSWHGATTVVMGNCGVGFAPVRRGDEGFLIELMEGVEDIPGSALHEGIDWQWDSFPSYLDALASMPRVLDVAAQVPHAAVRAYVLGERAHEAATADEIGEMARVVREAMEAGAAGFTTSRTILHRSKHGLVPGTVAPADELRAIADAMGEVGRGVFQLISDQHAIEPERSLIGELARRAGVPVTLSLAQGDHAPEAYRQALADAAGWAREGLRVAPQVASRPVGMLFGLRSSLHPFITHPTYRRLADLPLDERVAQLRRPEVRERLLGEQPGTDNPIAIMLISRWHQIFPLGAVPDYEPPPSASAAAVAAQRGVTPQEVVLDWMLAGDGEAFLFAPLANYAAGNLDPVLEMMTHPSTVVGLGDGGAHCGLICDASMTTYLLTHWVRDRDGERLGLEQAVRMQTADNAALYGITDRGVVAVGMRADLNVVDLDALSIAAPEMVFDLPAQGRRLVQRATGYDATIVAGQVTFERGEPTGARPGGVVREFATAAGSTRSAG
jgi:N-acyl-D-aspartate/D-glutamate deacylase